MAVAFAESFCALGPLVSTYESYAQYQFYGMEVHVPFDLCVACEQTTLCLASLRDELACQSASVGLDVVTDAAWLALDAEAFCLRYGTFLQSLSSTAPAATEILDTAGDARLFAAIHALDDRLQLLMSDVFDGLPAGCAVWTFAVAFSVQTILNQSTFERIDPGLRAILYGAADSTGPPFVVPAPVETAMATLIGLQEVDLSEGDVEVARTSAEIILLHLLSADVSCETVQ